MLWMEFGNGCSCCPLVDTSKPETALVIRISHCFGVFLTHLLQDATDSRVFIQVLMDGFFRGIANLFVWEAYDWIDLQGELDIKYGLFFEHIRGYNISVLVIYKNKNSNLLQMLYLVHIMSLAHL